MTDPSRRAALSVERLEQILAQVEEGNAICGLDCGDPDCVRLRADLPAAVSQLLSLLSAPSRPLEPTLAIDTLNGQPVAFWACPHGMGNGVKRCAACDRDAKDAADARDAMNATGPLIPYDDYRQRRALTSVPAAEATPASECWHGHTTRQVGCVSCVLVFDSRSGVTGARHTVQSIHQQQACDVAGDEPGLTTHHGHPERCDCDACEVERSWPVAAAPAAAARETPHQHTLRGNDGNCDGCGKHVRCRNLKPGDKGCQLHNLQCGHPQCLQVVSPTPAREARP